MAGMTDQQLLPMMTTVWFTDSRGVHKARVVDRALGNRYVIGTWDGHRFVECVGTYGRSDLSLRKPK